MVLPALLQAQKLDAILVSTLVNVRYYSGFTGSNGILVVTRKGTTLFTDPRYTTQASQEANCAVEVVSGPLSVAITKHLKQKRVKRMGVEDTRISYQLHRTFSENFTLVGLGTAVEQPRWVKTAAEIDTIRASVALNSKALEKALKRFKPGITESDLAAEIDYQMRRLGAGGSAFDTIVAAGAHSALPHAQPRPEKIEPGGYLLIDMGACYRGYMSDMTRTFGVVKMPRRAGQIYRAVFEAQLAAIDAVRPGVRAAEVHKAAVAVLAGHNLAEAFIHSTGHGLGLEIHEAPRLGKADETMLEAGMTITIEPGVYLAGFGGVRIEDTVLVTDSGAEVLTKTPKDWTILS